MSQHDYVLDNNPGQAFRFDLNDALLAIVSQNSGAIAPSTTYAFQLWADTANDLLKIRNAANSAWINVGTLSAVTLGLLSRAGGTMTGALLLKVGSESLSTPAMAFDTDANTGVHRPAADQISLVAGGTEFLRCDLATYAKFLITSGLLLPSGTTAQRPTGANGILRFNSDLNIFEGYRGGTWGQLGGGGGGAGFQWKEISSGKNPVKSDEYGEEIYLFDNGEDQELYGSIKVPASYSTGSPIKIYVSGYSPSSSNTILFKAVSTLIAKNSTAADDTTNQRTTTNTALTNTVAKQVREFILDITNSTGQINGVSVAAGDTIKFKLYRDTDTDTAQLRLLPNQSDISYS